MSSLKGVPTKVWGGAGLLLGGLSLGCAVATVSEKLGAFGLELVSEEEARIPPAERGRYLPCRVIPGFPAPALPEHPAGYLIVGVDRRLAERASTVLSALEAWRRGQRVVLWVRRNPFALAGPEWWETDVVLKLP